MEDELVDVDGPLRRSRSHQILHDQCFENDPLGAYVRHRRHERQPDDAHDEEP